MNSINAITQARETQMFLHRTATQFICALTVPSQADANEFCTPGHHAGRLYAVMAHPSFASNNATMPQVKDKRI